MLKYIQFRQSKIRAIKFILYSIPDGENDEADDDGNEDKENHNEAPLKKRKSEQIKQKVNSELQNR